MASQPLEAAGYHTRMDVVARIHGGGVSAQANALRHGIARALVEADPALRARAEAPRLPHARPAREGAQEGRAQEGPQAAAVLEALERPMALFGTDGVRGVAGEFLTAELALRLGPRGHAHLAGRAPAGADRPRHARVGRDARGRARRRHRRRRRARAARRRAAHPGRVACSCGATASTWRPWCRPRTTRTSDNGIKFFGPEGMKSRDDQEAEIERRLGGAERAHRPRCASCTAPADDYLRELELRFARPRPQRACASCSTARTAPPTAWRPRSSAGSARDVDAIAVEPDGRNINDGRRLDARRPRWPSRLDGHDVGFAFDGDGDRVLAVDRNGDGRGRRRADGAGRAPPARAAAGCPATAWP